MSRRADLPCPWLHARGFDHLARGMVIIPRVKLGGIGDRPVSRRADLPCPWLHARGFDHLSRGMVIIPRVKLGGISRAAFSLLEVIIATAILAGSAIVLISLISLGAKYGNRAEERTIATSQAQSILDEFIASIPSEEIREEVSGILPGTTPRNFRIEVTPFEPTGNSGANNREASNGLQSALYRVKIKLFESNGALVNEDSEPLCQLSRLVRRPRIDEPSGGGINSETSLPSANLNRATRNARKDR